MNENNFDVNEYFKKFTVIFNDSVIALFGIDDTNSNKPYIILNSSLAPKTIKYYILHEMAHFYFLEKGEHENNNIKKIKTIDDYRELHCDLFAKIFFYDFDFNIYDYLKKMEEKGEYDLDYNYNPDINFFEIWNQYKNLRVETLYTSSTGKKILLNFTFSDCQVFVFEKDVEYEEQKYYLVLYYYFPNEDGDVIRVDMVFISGLPKYEPYEMNTADPNLPIDLDDADLILYKDKNNNNFKLPTNEIMKKYVIKKERDLNKIIKFFQKNKNKRYLLKSKLFDILKPRKE